MDIIIKKAQKLDAFQLLNLYQTSWLEPDILLEDPDMSWTVDNEIGEIIDHASGNNLYLTAWSGKQIIGYLKFTGGQYQKNRHSGQLEILVRKEFRRSGVGKKLMTDFLTWAKKNNIKRIELEVWSNNKPAINFYKKFNFKQEGRKIRAYKINHKYIDGLMMAKILK